MKKTIYTLVALIITVLSLLLVSCGTTSETSDVAVSETASTTEVSLPSNDESSKPADDGKATYTVTVVDEDNKPIEGITIQFCDDKNCKLPMVTNADGVVVGKYDEKEYHITVTDAKGYTAEAEYFFEDGSFELTIVLKK